MTYEDELIARCDILLRTGIVDIEEANALVGDFLVAYGKDMRADGLRIQPTGGAADLRSIGSIKSWLCRHRDKMEHELALAKAAAAATSVMASSYANAKASVKQNFADAFRAIERANDIADGQKERLEDLLSQMESAAENHDQRSFAHTCAEWMGLAADSATVLTACAPFIATLLGILAGA